MRAFASQFADFCITRRRMRVRGSGIVALAVLASLLGACGGTGRNGVPESDPSSPNRRSIADWQAELLTVEQNAFATPDEPYWPHRAAEIQLALELADQARASLTAALALDPDYSPALLLRSKLDYQDGRYEDAVLLLEPALSRSTRDTDPLRIALALNLEALGEVEAARQLLSRCAQDPTMRRGAETFLSLRGEGYLESRDIAATALDADPRSASNHNNFGIALLYDGDPEAARESFLRALELDPRIAGALYNLAIVDTYYFYDLEQGRAWFERYAELQTDDPDELGAVFGIDLAAADPARRTWNDLEQGTGKEDRDAH